VNLIFAASVGAQAEQWFRDTLASSTIDFDAAITATVTVTVVAEPSCPGHNDFMCTSPDGDGWLIEIRRGADDPASPLLANIPGPARLFFMECVAHELAHVLAGEHVASDEARATVSALFVRTAPTGSIGATGELGNWASGEWEDRIEEAVAETVKDAALPDQRVYDNRTHWRVPQDNYPALMATVLGGASGEFADDFAVDSSARYVDPAHAVFSGGRVHNTDVAGATLKPDLYLTGDVHVQAEVLNDTPDEAIVAIVLTDPITAVSAMIALYGGDVLTLIGAEFAIEPAAFGAHAFLDLQVNATTTTATVSDASHAVLYSKTVATPAALATASQPSLLLSDTVTEAEGWTVTGDPVTLVVTPAETVPEQRTPVALQQSAISHTFEDSDTFPRTSQLFVWAYDVTDVDFGHAWGAGVEHIDVHRIAIDTGFGEVTCNSQVDITTYTDGTVPIADTPFTDANVWVGGFSVGPHESYRWWQRSTAVPPPDEYGFVMLNSHAEVLATSDFVAAFPVISLSADTSDTGDQRVYAVLTAAIIAWSEHYDAMKAIFDTFDPVVEHVIPEHVIPESTAVVPATGVDAPDWPYVPPFVGAAAGAPAATRLSR
jgi:hypothetical protein